MYAVAIMTDEWSYILIYAYTIVQYSTYSLIAF